MKKQLTLLAALCTASGIFATDRNGVIEGLNVSIDHQRIHRANNNIIIELTFHNSGEEFDSAILVDACSSKLIIDGEKFFTVSPQFIKPGHNDETTVCIHAGNIPIEATSASLLLRGRAQNSRHANENNFYGDYCYTFSEISLPTFTSAESSQSAIYDNTISHTISSIAREGNDIVIDMNLFNKSTDTYAISKNLGGGSATTSDGRIFALYSTYPESLPPRLPRQFQLRIPNGGAETFSTIRQEIIIQQDNRPYMTADIVLRDISVK